MDAPRFTHVTLQQTWARYPVFGAQLRVHLTPALGVSSISGNYVRDPHVVTEATVAESDALDTAVQAIARIRLANGNGGHRRITRRELADGVLRVMPRVGDANGAHLADVDETAHATLNDVRGEIVSKGLVILPGELSRVQDVGNHFAYHLETREAQVFVSAATGEIVFAIPNIQTTNRLVYDAQAGNKLTGAELVVYNGAPAPGITLNPDAAARSAALAAPRRNSREHPKRQRRKRDCRPCREACDDVQEDGDASEYKDADDEDYTSGTSTAVKGPQPR